MTTPFYTPPDVLDEQALSLEQLAAACRMAPQWVVERVTTGVLQCDTTGATGHSSPQSWRFSTHTVIRARRIAQLERTFEADPELAALTADLMEEVRQLRRRIRG
ncbi:chaperone modulator CbpM [Comamonas aquatica]|uniref:Chaperone modulator CbpM n=1 Tax=Comamonas aquatica TaxID=225991 RepID=A0AA43AWC6_9BURK|nr:chaperone modulator CbpM [Comamonas aquatica]MDH1427836.1 chaperone modulator CbpM [Comamonas aquatica]MDH1605823.1 chaperone modulator CbpM [Comamonas aquatica]MDH1616489.1 chaperone modulator CbpM [Comamonas aquatica]MDH2004361.1 chaperone modulator CbpM [Comamonas aquatica]